jgi:hypothetical protein
MHSMLPIPTPERLAVTTAPSAGVRAIVECTPAARRSNPGSHRLTGIFGAAFFACAAAVVGKGVAAGMGVGSSFTGRETRVARDAGARKQRSTPWCAGNEKSEFVTGLPGRRGPSPRSRVAGH